MKRQASLRIVNVLMSAFMTVLIGCISIVKLPNYGDNDVYAENKQYLEKPGKIAFIEITAQELIEKHHEDIYLFSTWCSHCFYHLSHLTPETKGITKYVAANYDIRFMQKRFTALDTIFIISNAAYGSKESQKINAFVSELLKETIPKAPVRIPQKFAWNSQEGRFKRLP